MLVADCDRESSEVCPDDLDGLIRRARNLQILSLALVRRLVTGPVRPDPCNNTIILLSRKIFLQSN